MYKIRFFKGIAFGYQQTDVEINHLYDYFIVVTDFYFCCIHFQHVKLTKK
jgi:hypothetical protein